MVEGSQWDRVFKKKKEKRKTHGLKAILRTYLYQVRFSSYLLNISATRKLSNASHNVRP